MKKLRSVKWLLLLLFLAVLWIACGSNKNTSNLSESQKEHYREMTQHTINLFHEKKSAEIRQNSTEELKKALTERSEEHTSELQSRQYLVCRLLLEKKKKTLDITNVDK